MQSHMLIDYASIATIWRYEGLEGTGRIRSYADLLRVMDSAWETRHLIVLESITARANQLLAFWNRLSRRTFPEWIDGSIFIVFLTEHRDECCMLLDCICADTRQLRDDVAPLLKRDTLHILLRLVQLADMAMLHWWRINAHIRAVGSPIGWQQIALGALCAKVERRLALVDIAVRVALPSYPIVLAGDPQLLEDALCLALLSLDIYWSLDMEVSLIADVANDDRVILQCVNVCPNGRLYDDPIWSGSFVSTADLIIRLHSGELRAVAQDERTSVVSTIRLPQLRAGQMPYAAGV